MQFCKSCYVVVVVVIAVFIFFKYNKSETYRSNYLCNQIQGFVWFITFGALLLHKVEVIVSFSAKRDRHVQTKQTEPNSNCSIFCRLNLIPLLVTLVTRRCH